MLTCTHIKPEEMEQLSLLPKHQHFSSVACYSYGSYVGSYQKSCFSVLLSRVYLITKKHDPLHGWSSPSFVCFCRATPYTLFVFSFINNYFSIIKNWINFVEYYVLGSFGKHNNNKRNIIKCFKERRAQNSFYLIIWNMTEKVWVA